jgi:tripartite-type tricarboxylate transporter receptor subunit TctC
MNPLPRAATRRRVLQSIAAGAASLGVGRLLAQDDKSTITVLVGAATTMDATARMVSEQLSSALGRPVITVSKLGAGGRLALGELRRSAPDGRTLMVSTSSVFAIYPNIYTKLEYDPAADFTPVAGICWFDVGLATGPATGADGGLPDLQRLLAWAKAKGAADALYGAAPGNGSSSHFAGIAMTLASGVPMAMVPYKDSNIGVGDLIGGRLPMLITGTGAMTEMHKVGKLRLIATSGTTRTPLVNDVPTFQEAGLDVNVVNSVGLYGPARLAPEIVARLAAVIDSMLGNAEQRSRLLAMGMTPLPMTAPQLAASLASERKRYALLVKRSGYVPEAS